jgi:hypothetical protein
VRTCEESRIVLFEGELEPRDFRLLARKGRDFGQATRDEHSPSFKDRNDEIELVSDNLNLDKGANM